MASEAKQRKIDNFFSLQRPVSSKSIVAPLIEDIIADVFKSKRAHINVNESTLKMWKRGYPWLSVMEDDNEVRLKCNLCVKYKASNVWASEGAVNIQKSAIDRHCTSKYHLEAQKKDVRSSQCSLSDSEDDADVCDLDKKDIFLIRTIYSLMKSEIPLNQLDSILELQRLNGVELPYQNLSWTTTSEIQDIIAKQYKKDLVREINSANYYAILLDESMDISVSKRLSVCVRYVKNGQPITTFLASTEISDGGAYTIVEAVHKIITMLGLDLTKRTSLATDGASVMIGKKTGVGVQLKSKFCPFITQTHCIAHRLNLAVSDAVKNNETLKKFKQMFETLYNFMSASTARINKLKAMQDLLNEPEIRIKEPHSIRWLGLKKSVEVVYECYGSLLATLSLLATENPTAKGLYKYFSSYKTALLIGLMLDVHTELGKLSCSLQHQSLIFSDVFPLIEGAIGKLNYIKYNEGDGLNEMKKSITFDSPDSQPSYKGETLKYYKKEASDSEFESVKSKYIDNLTSNIKKRIWKEDSEVLSSLGLLLEPVSYSSDHDSALECVTKVYCEAKVTKKTVNNNVEETLVSPLLDGHKLKSEWYGINAMSTGCYKTLSLKDFCKKIILKHHDAYPNFAKLAEIGLCMEITRVECERSFSAQNRLKTKYRAALNDESLEALMTISLLGPPLANFNPVPAVQTWNKTKARRKKRLVQPYKSRASKTVKKL